MCQAAEGESNFLVAMERSEREREAKKKEEVTSEWADEPEDAPEEDFKTRLESLEASGGEDPFAAYKEGLITKERLIDHICNQVEEV